MEVPAMPKTSRAQLEAVKRYNNAHTRTITIRLNHRTDADILEWLEDVDNIAGAVKRAIRSQIDDELWLEKGYDV
jgi:hypothetical protein